MPTYLTPFPHHCKCGRAHTQAEWKALPLVGYHHVPKDGFGPAEDQEWRNCECGSTVAVLIEKPVKKSRRAT